MDEDCATLIKGINAVPVQRNSGIDGFLKECINDGSVAIRIQRENETLTETVDKLLKATGTKHCSYIVVIRTHSDYINTFDYNNIPDKLLIIDRYDLQILELTKKAKKKVAVGYGDLLVQEGDIVILYTQSYLVNSEDLQI